MADYSTDNNDRLLEHHAQRYAEARGVPIEQARAMIDCAPEMQGILGRTPSDGDYERSRLSAYRLAGIADTEQLARLAEIEADRQVFLAGLATTTDTPNGTCDVCDAPIPDALPGEVRRCDIDPSHDPYSDGFANGGDPIRDEDGNEIDLAEIMEPSAIEPVGALDAFAGPIDHIDGLMEMRDGILRADDQRAELARLGDYERLANGAADLKVIIGDLNTLHRATRADIADLLIAKHEREGGNPRRRPKVEVEGLGTVEVPSGNERKNWRSPELLQRLIVLATIDTETGQRLQDDPLDAAQAIYDTLMDCLPITPSLGWRVGTFDKATETWTGLRGWKIDPDEWSDEVAKDRLAEIPKRAS